MAYWYPTHQNKYYKQQCASQTLCGATKEASEELLEDGGVEEIDKQRAA